MQPQAYSSYRSLAVLAYLRGLNFESNKEIGQISLLWTDTGEKVEDLGHQVIDCLVFLWRLNKYRDFRLDEF